MHADLKTALSSDGATVFDAIEIVCSGGTIRMLDGGNTVTIEGHSFVGEHATWGSVDLSQEISDSIAGDVSQFDFSFRPVSDDEALNLLDLLEQGSSVRKLFGAINPDTGALIGAVEEDFIGTIDVATLISGKGVCMVTVEAVSVWQLLQEPDEGLTMTDAPWQAIKPGELMFAYVTDVQRQIPWGADAPRPSVVTNISSPTAGAGFNLRNPLAGSGGGTRVA